MKIFEELEWIDGGPSDKGVVKGYHLSESEKQLKEKFKIDNGFISFREISKEEYDNRKKELENKLKMFSI